MQDQIYLNKFFLKSRLVGTICMSALVLIGLDEV